MKTSKTLNISKPVALPIIFAFLSLLFSFSWSYSLLGIIEYLDAYRIALMYLKILLPVVFFVFIIRAYKVGTHILIIPLALYSIYIIMHAIIYKSFNLETILYGYTTYILCFILLLLLLLKNKMDTITNRNVFFICMGAIIITIILQIVSYITGSYYFNLSVLLSESFLFAAIGFGVVIIENRQKEQKENKVMPKSQEKIPVGVTIFTVIIALLFVLFFYLYSYHSCFLEDSFLYTNNSIFAAQGNLALFSLLAATYYACILISAIWIISASKNSTQTTPVKNVGTVIILTLFFGWIYLPIWAFHVANHSKSTMQSKPITQAFLCMIIPIYAIFWIYAHSSALHRKYLEKDARQSDFSALHTIVFLFFPIIGMALFQAKINEYYSLPSQPVNNTENQPQQAPKQEPKQSEPDLASKLREYKALLDEGVITEQEFTEMKNKLLKKAD